MPGTMPGIRLMLKERFSWVVKRGGANQEISGTGKQIFPVFHFLTFLTLGLSSSVLEWWAIVHDWCRSQGLLPISLLCDKWFEKRKGCVEPGKKKKTQQQTKNNVLGHNRLKNQTQLNLTTAKTLKYFKAISNTKHVLNMKLTGKCNNHRKWHSAYPIKKPYLLRNRRTWDLQKTIRLNEHILFVTEEKYHHPNKSLQWAPSYKEMWNLHGCTLQSFFFFLHYYSKQ